MEGKEVRFGVAASALFATVTTDASCGAVNAMHDSFTPLGGLVPLVNIQLGEVIFGGVGAGLYGMLVFVVLAVFIAGLMVGRTPEYLGKKIEATRDEAGDALRAGLPDHHPGLFGLGGGLAARDVVARTTPGRTVCPRSCMPSPVAPATTARPSPASTPTRRFWNITLGLAMLAGRFLMIIPVLAIAGLMVDKKVVPPAPERSPRTARCSPALLVMVVVIVGALTFFPALSLGPIVEHFLSVARKGVLTMSVQSKASCLFDRAILRRRWSRASASSSPEVAKNPVMFVVEIGSALTTLWLSATHRPRAGARAALVHRRGVDLAVVHRAVRQLRRGDRRRPRQGAGRHAAQDAQGDDGTRLLDDGKPTAAKSRAVVAAAQRAIWWSSRRIN